MHPDWESVLRHTNACIENSVAQHFGDRRLEAQAASASDVISPLTQSALIQISGPDKASFCQGQFTNDISLVNTSQSQLSAFCSPKGRMLACFRIFQQANDYYLTLPQELATPTLKRLQLFVLRAKTSLTHSRHWLGLGLSGPNAEILLADCLGQAVPATLNTTLTITLAGDALCVIRVPGVLPRFELYGDVPLILSYWEQLTQQARPVGASSWTLLDIQAGLPSLTSATSDAFVPQMANLDILDGISFHKGCYVGQEIVARMHYLGRLKRRMFRYWLDTERLPAAGAELFTAALHDEQSVGQIVSSAPSPNGGSEALAILTLAYAATDLRLADQSACKIEQWPLPYALPSDNSKPIGSST